MDVARFEQKPILGILRGVKEDMLQELVETVIFAGLETLEITMNTTNAGKLIQKTIECATQRLMVGAGTVLTLDSLKEALDAGASFIVMPVFNQEIVEYCVARSIPVFPGAFTPQEIYTAYSAGATMVKVFPSKFFGPSYIKEIKAPLDKVKILACGGVSVSTIKDYFANGANAVAFGGSIFKQEWLDNHNFKDIQLSIECLIEQVDL